MAFHVVTNRCFLACEKVTSVVIEQLVPDRPIIRKKKPVKGKRKATAKEMPKQFNIHIAYYPLAIKSTSSNSYNNSTDECTLDIRVFGKKQALMLYAEIIREVQEQHPGEGYLDKLVEKMLSTDEFKFAEHEINNAND